MLDQPMGDFTQPQQKYAGTGTGIANMFKIVQKSGNLQFFTYLQN